MHNPNVLHVRSTLGLYGAEKVLLNIAGAEGSSHMSFFLIEGLSEQSCKLRNILNKQGRPLDSKISNKKFDISIIRTIRKILKHNKINIIHTHDYKSLVLASFAAVFTPAKIVHHVHGILGNTRAEKLYAIIERIFMLTARRVVTVSMEQKDNLKNSALISPKVLQINNGTPLLGKAVSSASKPDALTLIMVARFTPEKNHKLAIDVMKTLIQKGVNLHLNLLGDGEQMLTMEQYVKASGLSEHVTFLGFQDNVDQHIACCHALLITSKTEGLPMAMLEAMAAGVPIISTPVGEIPNILQASGAGFIAKNQEGFVRLITRLAHNQDELLPAGEQAKNYLSQHLSVDAQVSALNHMYQELVAA